MWSRDGRELFYTAGNQLVAVSVSTDSVFEPDEPRVLFEGPYELHDVSLDGQQFLMIKTDASPRTRIRIVQNWSRDLERLAPLPE